MKNIKKILVTLLSVTYSCTLFSQAPCATTPQTTTEECEDGKGISTNPVNPINCEGADASGQPITWRLNTFNWLIKNPQAQQLVEYYNFWKEGSTAGEPNSGSVENPFISPSDAEYYRWVTNASNSDYQPKDGWELMKVEFGSPEGAIDEFFPKLPYIMLYNKFSGTLRFFGTLSDPISSAQTVEVKLKIPKFSPGIIDPQFTKYESNLSATNLLSVQGESIQPLDKETSENTMSVFVEYTNNEEVFFWFDIPLAYDPCVCQFKSQFDVSFAWIKKADIDITGDITGSIKTQTTANGGNEAVKVFGRVLAAGISTAVAIKTGGAIVNVQAYKELVDVFKDKTTSQSEKDALGTLSDIIGCAKPIIDFAAGDYDGLTKEQSKNAKAGKKILDASTKFFSSLEKECGNATSKTATTISGRIEASGTITEIVEISGTSIELAMPGSKWVSSLANRKYTVNNKLVPAYPLYNERLGTFALLKTPKFNVSSTADHCVSERNTIRYMSNPLFQSPVPEIDNIVFDSKLTWSMRLSENLSYSFNPNLNLNPEKTKILVRFVMKKDETHFSQGNFSYSKNFPFQSCIGSDIKAAPLNTFYIANGASYVLMTPNMPIDQIQSMPVRLGWVDRQNKEIPSTMDNTAVNFMINNVLGATSDISGLQNNVFVQFTIVGESLDLGSDGKPNTLFQILTFPVDLNETNADPNSNITEGNYIQEVGDFSTDVNFNSSGNLYYDGPVFISAKMATSLGAKVKIYSLKGFVLEPGATLSPDIELIHGSHLPKIAQPEATYSEVSSFCSNTTEYKANSFSAPAIQDMKIEADRYNQRKIVQQQLELYKLTINLYPNPTSSIYNVKVIGNNEKPFTVMMYDLTGKIVLTQNYDGKTTTNQINASKLTNGVYIVKVICGEEVKVQKLIKQSLE